MSWDNITGNASILPSVSGGNEVILEENKPKRIRLINDGSQPYSFFQHSLEAEVMENGQLVKTFRTVNCAKTAKNPLAPCKLCDGQKAKRRVRHATNAWDYDVAGVRKLAAGEDTFKPIGTIRTLGQDIYGMDFAITKTGKGRDTSYSVVSLGLTPFALPANVALFDIENEYRPHTEEEMRSIVEGIGLSWQDLITPPDPVYPASLQEALSHIMPNTKYKGQTIGQIWDANRGMIDFLSKSNRVSYEKSCAQVVLVSLGGIHIEGVPNYSLNNVTSTPSIPMPVTPVVNVIPSPVQVTPVVNTTPTPVQVTPIQVAPVANVTPAPVQVSNGADRQTKIDQINTQLQTNQKFVNGGYQAIIGVMQEATAPNNKVSIVEFTDSELDKMLALCQ